MPATPRAAGTVKTCQAAPELVADSACAPRTAKLTDESHATDEEINNLALASIPDPASVTVQSEPVVHEGLLLIKFVSIPTVRMSVM